MKNSNINKHLTFEERCKIEECINKGFRKYQIANELNKSQSTILREIRNNRVFKPRKIFNENPFKILLIAFILKIAKFVLVNVNTMKLQNVIVEINSLVLVTIAQILKSVN